MTTPSLPPLSQDLPAAALQVLAHADAFTTQAEGGRIQWHAWGQGRPLVLLHGGSGSWTHWVRNVDALAAAGRRVLVPDLPGFGDSDKLPEAHDADTIAPALGSAISEITGGTPTDVVGFSFGGLTAGLLAADQPGRIGRLVLVGAPGFGLRSRRIPLRTWRGLPDAEAREAHRFNLQALMLHAPDAADDFAIALQSANTARDRMLRRKLALSDALAIKLPALACPVHGIWGAHDTLSAGVLPQVAAALATAPGFGEMVVVPDAGHWVQFEAPDAFNTEVLRLLA